MMGGLASAAFETILRFVLGDWSKSFSKACKEAIVMLNGAPTADLSASWFKALWNDSFALVVLLALVLMLLFAVLFSFTGLGGHSLSAQVVNVFHVCMVGIFFLLVIWMAQQTISIFTNLIVALPTGQGAHSEWYTPLVQGGSLKDLWGGLALSFIGLIAGGLLWVEAYVIQHAMYIITIWWMFAFACRNTFMGKWLYDSAISALMTSLLFKLLGVAVLKIWSVIIDHADNATGAAVLTVIAVVLVAAMPIGMYQGMQVLRIRTEGRTMIEGSVDTRRSREEDSRMTSSVRASSSAAMSPVPTQNFNEVESMSDAAKTAAKVALVSIAIERGGHALSQKALASGHPEAAAGIALGSKAAAGVGARYTERRGSSRTSGSSRRRRR